MLHGKFEAGRPYFETRIVFQRSGPRPGILRLLFDTGADRSVLAPADANKLGIDYDLLTDGSRSFGIGGSVTTYQETAFLAFSDPDDGRLFGYSIDVGILDKKAGLRVPSLLGRDVINRWRVIYDHSNSTLEAEVVSSDFEIPA